MNKQIEEMVKIMNETCNVYDEQGNHIRNKCYECECWSDDNHCCCSYNSKEAETLYNAGYRKSTDVVREFITDFEKSCFGYFGEFYASKYVNFKKKYESEERK